MELYNSWVSYIIEGHIYTVKLFLYIHEITNLYKYKYLNFTQIYKYIIRISNCINMSITQIRNINPHNYH